MPGKARLVNCGWVSTAHVEFIQNGKKGTRLSKQGALGITLAKLEKSRAVMQMSFYSSLHKTDEKTFEAFEIHHEQGRLGTWVCSDKLHELGVLH